jgi:hypothetical protein
MNQFHVNLLALPEGASFGLTWEEAAAALQRLPRMIFELDGSFVILGIAAARRWQVDGHLFDFNGQLHRVELRGTCPPEALDELLRCVGWPEQKVIFEVVKEGVCLDEAAFRQLARGLP